MTKYHDYNIPNKGASNWHEPLNDNFRQIDNDIEVRETEANRTEYTPEAGVKFLATDTGRTYIGDGSNWQPLSLPAGAKTPSIVCFQDADGSYA
ncbi:hypothetical protein, partial [Haloarcula salinisoli]|nr:hypothetical protein [Halomicroarcula salinisoli]MBX0306067.1 hypothetical protein [Halomicroarcula salinisoli]